MNIKIEYAGIKNTYIKYIYIKVSFIRDIELIALAKLRVILEGQRVYDCCF